MLKIKNNIKRLNLPHLLSAPSYFPFFFTCTYRERERERERERRERKSTGFAYVATSKQLTSSD
jgi:hypothetical protein